MLINEVSSFQSRSKFLVSEFLILFFPGEAGLCRAGAAGPAVLSVQRRDEHHDPRDGRQVRALQLHGVQSLQQTGNTAAVER